MRYPTLLCLLLIVAGPLAAGAAPIAELSQADLRRSVSSGESMGVKEALKTIRQSVPGDPVDVRAFEGDGVYYRVLMIQASGIVRAVVIDAATGKVLPSNSKAARDVNAKAGAKGGASVSATTNAAGKTANGKSTGAGQGGGNGNSGGGSGGNGGGNSGGNGGGNSGGNGGGNSGGNGGGNSGGNGGGNSGGNGGGKGGGNGKS